MSGDVTAAIESDLPHACETWAVGREVFDTETDATYIDRILAALPVLIEEVGEQARRREQSVRLWADSVAEVERLRAEREALLVAIHRALDHESVLPAIATEPRRILVDALTEFATAQEDEA